MDQSEVSRFASRKRDLAARAHEAITNTIFEVNDLNNTSHLPITTNQWRINLIPFPDTGEEKIIAFIKEYKESIAYIDFTELAIANQNNLLIAIIRFCKNIECLKLEGEWLKLDSFQNLKSLTKLIHLEINHGTVSPDFTGMGGLKSLKFTTKLPI